MIVYVESRLLEWAEWSRMRLDGWYGGGGQFGYDEPLPASRGLVRMPSNARCMVTEQCVALLRKENRPAGDCVVVRFREHPGWSAELQAQFLGVSVRTFWRRLDMADLMLWGYFAERDMGLVPQTEMLRLRKLAAA